MNVLITGDKKKDQKLWRDIKWLREVVYEVNY
jgi:hypothetical protein